MAAAIDAGRDSKELKKLADEIRWTLNPHPAGQMEHNVPRLSDGTPLPGMQHKYRETALFFASQGQTCHAYCTFCFRWPQFVGLEGEKFAMREAELLTRYVGEHHEISDVLFTGGDPLIMKTKTLRSYIEPGCGRSGSGRRRLPIGRTGSCSTTMRRICWICSARWSIRACSWR